VKEEQVGTYIYLPEWQSHDLSEFVEDAQYHYKKAYDIKLEKNRHLYPLVVQHGLEELDGTDPDSLQERLADLNLRPK
jgi:hypothetical protein